MDKNENKNLPVVDSQEAIKSDSETNAKLSEKEMKNEALPDELQSKENLPLDDFDQELYQEVLEKLDILPEKAIDKEFSEGFIQKNEKEKTQLDTKQERSLVEIEVEKTLARDFQMIQKLMQAGVVSSAQGQNLKTEVLKKAFDKLVLAEKNKNNPPSEYGANSDNVHSNLSGDKNKVFEEFSKENPNFFSTQGRKEVLDYLKSDGLQIDKEGLSQISDLIRGIEKTAIERYLQKVAYEKTLANSNESAKQRLTANAQKTGASSIMSKTFTREQIGKMSSAEFTKYESAIMEQLKKGLIR